MTSLRTNLSAWDSPLIAVGGSLSGEMSAWWRVRYPFIVDMALAASAPIFGFPGEASNGAPLCDQFAWERVATEAFRTVGGDACVESLRAGYWQTSALAPAAVTAAFDTCTPATLPCHAQQVANAALYWTGTAAELGSYPPHVNRSLLEWACGVMAPASSGLDAYVRLMAPLLPGQCLNISWSQSCDGDAGGGRVAAAAAAASADRGGFCALHWNESDSGCQDGWGIESCTTEIHPINSNNVSDMYPPSVEVLPGDRLRGCRQSYGADLSIDGGAMPRNFGQLDQARMAASASRIIFSSGEYDPWSSMSVNRSLSPSLPFVFIAGGAHHSDIGNNCEQRRGGSARARSYERESPENRAYPSDRPPPPPFPADNPVPGDFDSPALIAAREVEIDYLKRWVQDFHAERAAAKAFIAREERAGGPRATAERAA